MGFLVDYLLERVVVGACGGGLFDFNLVGSNLVIFKPEVESESQTNVREAGAEILIMMSGGSRIESEVVCTGVCGDNNDISYCGNGEYLFVVCAAEQFEKRMVVADNGCPTEREGAAGGGVGIGVGIAKEVRGAVGGAMEKYA